MKLQSSLLHLTRVQVSRVQLRHLLLGFGLAWAVCLIPFWTGDTLPGVLGGDSSRIAPYRAYLTRTIWSGNFPDLSQGSFLGQPVMTYGQAALLYPSTIVGIILPLSHRLFFVVDLWVHLTLASAFFSLLLLRRGVSLAIALTFGWLYSNSSSVLFKSHGHWALLHQCAWLPLLVMYWEEWSRSGKITPRTALAMSAVVGLLLLAQNPQWLYLMFLFLIPFELLRIIKRKNEQTRVRRFAGSVGCCLGALLLGCPGWLPAAAGASGSFRGLALAGADLARAHPLQPANFISLITPYLQFGNRAGEYLGFWHPIESYLAFGRGAVILAMAGCVMAIIAMKRPRAHSALPLMFVCGGLFIGVAPAMPWFETLVKYLPLFDHFRSWGRASVFIVIGSLMLGANTLHRLTHGERQPGIASFITTVVITGTTAYLAWLAGDHVTAVRDMFYKDSEANKGLFRLQAAGVAPSLWRDAIWYGAYGLVLLCAFKRTRIACLLIPMFILESLLFQRFILSERAPLLEPATLPQLSQWIHEQTNARKPEPVTVTFLPGELANLAMHYPGLRNTAGADSDMRVAYGRWINQVQNFKPDSYQLDTYMRTFPARFLRNTGSIARIDRLASRDSDAKTAALTTHTVPLDQYAAGILQEHIPYAEVVGLPGISTQSATATTLDWTDDFSKIRVSTPNPAFVRVREFMDSRWQVEVNGKPVSPKQVEANLLVPVPAENSEVTLTYVDQPARIAVVISCIAWLAWATAMIRVRKVNRKLTTSA